MRFLHTADWHLGRSLHMHALVEDQAHVLEQLVQLVREVKPDALLVAGDVYDRAVPPPEAVALLDEVLSRIVVELRVPVVLIAGNHDSADRLGFGSRLLSSGGLHVAGRVGSQVTPLTLVDAHGEVHVYALPYGDPASVRDAFATQVHEHEPAMKLRLDALRVSRPANTRAVLVAHAFVTGGSESESERPLSIGGSGAVGAELFADFDYVALGHLHRPQTLKGNVRYAGSLLKYSLSEVDHKKSVTLVELGAPGDLRIEELSLTPRRDFRVIEGQLAQLVTAGHLDPHNEDYVHARLLDEGALIDPMARLQVAYPNAVDVRRVSLGEAATEVARVRRPSRTPSELFHEFYGEVTGHPLEDTQTTQLARVLDDLTDETRR
ncbi:MAG: exonuclease SbcCD subunit D [Polyangia bacterium]